LGGSWARRNAEASTLPFVSFWFITFIHPLPVNSFTLSLLSLYLNLNVPLDIFVTNEAAVKKEFK
jgi:hypothetical protein